MIKAGVVILSRYNSSRLEGKALMKINGKEILCYIIERLLQVIPIDSILIATSTEQSDDPIAEFAISQNVGCFRGSLHNVSKRFYQAAASQNWDYAVRINGDNVLLDTTVLKDMLSIVNSNSYDLISNVKGRTFPKGMSVEIVNVKFYGTLLNEIELFASYQEHVTLYIYEKNIGRHFYYTNNIMPETAGLQMALDTREDFERTEAIISFFKTDHWNYNLVEIYKIIQEINNEKRI